MPKLFNIEQPEVDELQQLADGILMKGEQVAEQIVRFYRMMKEDLWQRSALSDGTPFTLEHAQTIIDKMGPNAIIAFQKLGALGQFINTTYPGELEQAELSSPVAYTIENGRIVLDPEGVYPGPKTN
jgi:hypothetical protein